MKKITLLLIAAFVLGFGSMNAQTTGKKFRKTTAGTTKTEVKAEKKTKTEVKAEAKAKTEAKAESKTTGATFKKSEIKATNSNVTKATTKATATKQAVAAPSKATAVEKHAATATKKATTAQPQKAVVHATPVDKSNFNGFFTNTYGDGLGGTCTHRLTVNFDPASGTVKGRHTNESGVERDYHGKLVGDKLVCVYDEDGDEFAEMKLYDANTIKLEGFTGTFKRNDSDTPTISVSPSGQSGAAAVDREGLEAIQKYMREKEQSK
ncbi:MAG: hypothetical protein J6I72_08085 [Muribaculaceae bacterium]|nr:hypothetical protein [Muribaculaceae bacterium]